MNISVLSFRVHLISCMLLCALCSLCHEHKVNKKKIKKNRLHRRRINGRNTFIYTGKDPNVDQMASKLLFPADKYQLDHLKLMWEEVLCRDMKVENVVEMLVLADKCNTNQLKTICLKFIATHASETMQTPSWKSLNPAQEYHSLVTTEVFEATFRVPLFPTVRICLG